MISTEQLLSDLIRIDTVNPPGNETAAAEYLKEIFDQAGISSEIVETAPGRGSFFARLGEGEKKLLFLSHTDVVPAGEEGWNFPPLSGEIKDGIVYGRGAIDCKSLVAAQAAAMLKLKEEGINFNGTLIFAATADEEKAGTYGVKQLMKECPDRLTADFAVNEGGAEPVVMNGTNVYFIQVGEKGTAWSRIESRGTSCHGSMPTVGKNALKDMTRALSALFNYNPDIKLIPEVRLLLEEICKIYGLENSLMEENLDKILDNFNDKAFAEALRAMTRMTVSPNVVNGGNKTNTVPDYCSADVDIRILPGQDREYVLNELRECIGEQLSIDVFNYYPPTFSSSQLEYYKVIEETTREVAPPSTACLPHISPGATDSRFLREAGIPAYGIGHMVPDFDQQIRETIHGKNERIDIKSLHLRTDFLVKLAKNYLLQR